MAVEKFDSGILYLDVIGECGFANDEACRQQYNVVALRWERYNEKGGVANPIRDRVKSYAANVDPTHLDPKSIREEDKKQWQTALEEFVVVGQPYLQSLIEFRALCPSLGAVDIDARISRVTEQLRRSRTNIDWIVNN